MDILNKPISDLSFDEVAQFCTQGHPEGYQLDYKENLSPKGLAKHIAAFSNSRGGILILGVVEDTVTGIPKTWDGLANTGKLAEWAYQCIANVEPLPSCEVRVTDEKNGKVFLLVRIFEGDQTPYYAQNDANIWVRTGNISKSVELASPEAAELLFGKKEKAGLARRNYIERTKEVYAAALQRGETERLHHVSQEKAEQQAFATKIGQGQPSPYTSRYAQQKLGSNVTLSTVILQPYFPRKALLSPAELKEAISYQIRVENNFADFPHYDNETMQDGILRFDWRQDSGEVSCEQLYASGLVCNMRDVLSVDKDGKRKVLLARVAAQLFVTLKATGNFYRHVGYQGGVIGELSLDNVVQSEMKRVGHSGGWGSEDRPNLLSEYRWDLQLDTATLNDGNALKKFWIEKMREIYWSLGYEALPDPAILNILKEIGLPAT